MKRNHIFSLALLLAAASMTVGCSDDLGNYVYTPINEVDVVQGDDLVRGKTYNYVAHIDHMRFSPELYSSLGITDDSQYEYEWRIMPSGASNESVDPDSKVICREREIDYVILQRPGKYSCFFNVRDKASDVVYSVPFYIQVTSTTNEGWLVLCDVDDKARIDVIFNRSETEDLVARDMLFGYDYDPGKPQKLYFNFSRYKRATILVTDKDTYCLDLDDLHAGDDNRLAWDFGVSPDHLNIKASVMADYSQRRTWALIDQNDDIYTLPFNEVGGDLNEDALFTYPITMVEDKDGNREPFTPAPFIGFHARWQWPDRDNTNPFMFYDQTHSQFLVLTNTAVYPTIMDFEGEQLFENPTGGRQMVWLEPRRMHNNIASILRDPATGELFYYGIGMYSRSTTENNKTVYISYQKQDGYCRINGPEVERAERFAFHSLWNYLFYSVGSSIYQFDLSHPEVPAVKVLDFPGEEIAEMRFMPFISNYAYQNWQREREYDLVVGTNTIGAPDSECGTVRFYDIPDLMKPITLKKEFDGFGKIVNIVYKEPARG
ncbi:MAG: hypothetical protein K2K92_00840 [Duncaniella sp.]|nr:hypothetical protein [Duncaniella sp.]